MNISIWTDGSYNRHNNKCSCAYVIKGDNGFYHEQNFIITEGKLSTNIAEMHGIMQALKFVIEAAQAIPVTSIVVTSDSRYCVDGITDWIHKWKMICYQGKKNVAEWKQFYKLAYESGLKNLRFNWVKGHSGVEENERCDILCAVLTSTKPEKFLKLI